MSKPLRTIDFLGKKLKPGSPIFFGSGKMPEGYDQQIDPDGDDGEATFPLLTQADIQAIVALLVQELKIVGVVDGATIRLFVDVAPGTYTFTCEDSNGNCTLIGSETIGV